uniref:Disks large 3 n=1 Tax=Echinococcus granulosus TaxID=6210 RepID=A0A068WRM4_ECHGR|nr:disks large 3 [Echinococcus granulosus]
MHSKRSAERALREIIDFRDGLDKRTDKELIAALDCVVEVMQNHLYHAYLEVRDFYETTLLSMAIPMKVKADMALDIAGRWEQIDKSSSALSTFYTHSDRSSNELASGVRSRSLSHLTRPVTLEPGACKRSSARDRTSVMTSSFGRLDLRRHHHRYEHRLHQHNNNQEQHHSRRVRDNGEPLFDDNTEASSQSPSFGSVSVSNSSSERRRGFSSIFRVQLTRGPQGFGFSIAGGTDQEPPLPTIDARFVYVARITPGGVADLDGRLRVNDVILSVNGFGLVGLPHLKAVTIFEKSGAHLDLKVQRPQSAFAQEISRPVHLPTSPKISSTVSKRVHADRGSGGETHAASVRSRVTALSRSHCIILPAASNSPSPTESSGPPPTTVSPLSSLITSCQHPPLSASSNAEIPRKKVMGAGMGTAVTTAVKVVEEERQHNEGDVENEDEDDTVWFFDPEQTGSGRSVLQTTSNTNSRDLDADAASSNIKVAVEDNALSKPAVESERKRIYQMKKPSSPIPIDQWELSTRPQPDPSPGPIIVEVPLVRGTSNGFGFSIAGGIGTEFLEGDSGIFITKITSGGVADTSGRIAVGDRLIRVNSVSLVDVTHAEAVEALNTAGDFVFLLLVKVPLQSSPQWINRRQCQETVRNLRISPNPSTNKEGQITDRHPPIAAAEGLAERGQSHRRRPERRRLMPQQLQSTVLGPFNRTVEALPLSSSSHGSEDYAAAHAVPESILQRWPRARLVTLYKEEVPMASNGVGGRSGGSLGFSIVSGDATDGIFVSHIHPKGPAASSTAISVGDRLLMVNSTEVVGSTYEEAAILLKTAPSRVDLVLSYAPTEYKKLEDQIRTQTEVRSDDTEGEGDEYDNEGAPSRLCRSIEADGLFVRVLVNFDPHEVTELDQVIPCSAISVRSGDILQLINITDREWWQARIIHPSTCKPLGPAGLVPSRCRLEHQERVKWRVLFGRRSCLLRASSSETSSPLVSDPQSTDKAIESIPLSQSDGPIISSKQSSFPEASAAETRSQRRSTDSSRVSKKSAPRRAHSEFTREILPPTYIPVTSMQTVNTRPVVILGDLKHNISEDLLSEFPDDFSTCVPHTTRHRRRGEVDGRDYHFIKSRSRMESEIQLNRYIEAGEYNGNLYGTHLHSVFKVASAGFHCLLDVSTMALQRLTAAGLPPIAIFVLSNSPGQSLGAVNRTGAIPKQEKTVHNRLTKRREKNFTFLREYSPLLTAILIDDDYDKITERIHKIVQDNKGPNVWIASSDFLP